MPLRARNQVKAIAIHTASLAKWIGQATYLANNQPIKPFRDSTASRQIASDVKRKRATERAAALLAAGQEPTVATAKAPEAGGHLLVKLDNRWRCTSCKKWSKHWHKLAKGSCNGAIEADWFLQASKCHDGREGKPHAMVRSGLISWCAICGAYATDKAKLLRDQCPGQHRGPWKGGGLRGQLHKLLAGGHPTKGWELPLPDIDECPRELGLDVLKRYLETSDRRKNKPKAPGGETRYSTDDDELTLTSTGNQADKVFESSEASRLQEHDTERTLQNPDPTIAAATVAMTVTDTIVIVAKPIADSNGLGAIPFVGSSPTLQPNPTMMPVLDDRCPATTCNERQASTQAKRLAQHEGIHDGLQGDQEDTGHKKRWKGEWRSSNPDSNATSRWLHNATDDTRAACPTDTLTGFGLGAAGNPRTNKHGIADPDDDGMFWDQIGNLPNAVEQFRIHDDRSSSDDADSSTVGKSLLAVESDENRVKKRVPRKQLAE